MVSTEAESRDALIEKCIPIVKKVATEILRSGVRGIERQELEQIGYLQMLKAIDGRPANLGVRVAAVARRYMILHVMRERKMAGLPLVPWRGQC